MFEPTWKWKTRLVATTSSQLSVDARTPGLLWFQHLEALWEFSSSMCTFLWKCLYPTELSVRHLKQSFSRCFGAWRCSSWRDLLLRPSCLTISSAVSTVPLLRCCLNSYWSAIIAAFFSDVRWQLEEWVKVGD